MNIAWLRIFLLAGIALANSGCAYLTTYTRNIDLAGENSVAVDVKQRVVFSQLRPSHDGSAPYKVVCAEPSPDALTVLGVSGGLNLADTSTQKSVGATAALSESGAYVGLRTQSIQLLRDAMYRLCEGYAANAVDPSDFISMQRRYQSTMMGLIAIEQLTRPVVAGQVALATRANSTAGADVLLDKAEERFEAKSAARSAAEKDKADKELAATTAKKELQDKRDELSAEKDPQKIVELKKQVSEKVDGKSKADAALREAESKLATADRAMKEAELALAKARVTVSAGAAGEVRFASESHAAELTQTTKALANSVEDIVEEINFSYLREGCFNLLERSIHGSEAASNAANLAWGRVAATEKNSVGAAGLCASVIEKYASRFADKAATKRAKAETALLKAKEEAEAGTKK